ncbi:LLM class F420-dependent oxidoreductase [Nocardiopsis quinghaiensis]|uniref:LLM class F420-dependent oxidoreductase n=1 Tax=Nocardiopsis quinghaiensis TaxID=464995 RepID=UPI00123AB92E|nr:LLM class F420-dependent oxidoreductase [Nocardiopsis quinghaiensis]
MQLGVEIADFSWVGDDGKALERLVGVARAADSSGFSLIGVGDHLWQGPHAGGPEQPELECFTTLAVIAAHTTRCRLGPVVAGAHFRSPALLAKTVTTLDVLSGGRALLGVGAGWYEEEAVGLGIPFPPLSQRFDMLEETIQICLRLWEEEDEAPYEGAHHRLERPLSRPLPVTRPHPPIMVGGQGERRTLPLVAKYADACNLYPTPDLPDRLDTLRRLCDEAGRDYEEIEKTCIMEFDVGRDGSRAGELVSQLGGLAELGVTTAIGILPSDDPLGHVELVAEHVLPKVLDL